MDEALRLSTQQKLQQKLSPLQVQFVKALEMTTPEIEEEVRRTLDDNPALEAVEDDNADMRDDFSESAEEMQLADYGSEDDIPTYRLEAHNRSRGNGFYETVAVNGEDTLMDSLMAQLSQFPVTPRQLEIGQFIIGNIDDNGYLTRNINALVDDVAIQGGIEASAEELREVWDMVRQLDPPGVGAIDLRDCLLLQLRRRKRDEDVDLAIEIVADYFDVFSLMHYDRLLSMLGITEERLRRAMDVIKSLNPKPGSLLSGGSDDRSRQIIPDFLVEADGDRLVLTSLTSLPQLQIEHTFDVDDVAIPADVSRQQRDAILFLRQKRDEASNFIKVVKWRQETLYRVMAAIMKLQRDFFLTDDEFQLHPMRLKDVAAITGDDISVISRATAGKYVATHQGVYPLKFFFNERQKSESDQSAREVIKALRELIDGEDKRHPLSDDALASMLEEQGYEVARRTVAKYREKSGIPVARLRKKV